MTQAASTFFRSTAGHRFAHDSTCSFSGSGNGDRTSGWTWWHRLWALPRRRQRETLRKSFSIKSRFRVSEVRRILLDGLSRACVKLQCTRLVSYHSMIRNLALSFELFLDCIEAARFLPKTKIRIYNWILSTKKLRKLTGYLLGYSISTSCSSDRSSGGCLCAVAVYNATIQRLPKWFLISIINATT